jgi:hypothetical protein
LASDARLDAVGVGALESYASPNEPLPVLPAMSVQLPVAAAVAESGPLYELPTQLAIPETASVPTKDTPTGWLYQPLESGGRAAVPMRLLGSVLSIRIVTDVLTVWSPAVALHVWLVGPSVVTSCPGSQPVVDVMSCDCVSAHCMVTLLRNQPLFPAVPTNV